MTRLGFDGDVRRGVLERRYKRFFADVTLDGMDAAVTAHTPNTGSMTGLVRQGNPVLVTWNPSPKRKLQYSLQAIHVGESWVGTNTHLPNRLVEQAALEDAVAEFEGYRTVRREMPFPDGSGRCDLLLQDHGEGEPDLWVEVKSVTLREGDRALFPDSPSERGRKHLECLTRRIEEGDRAVMFYLVQRTDCAAFAPAAHVDPAYAEALAEAYERGLDIVCMEAAVEDDGIRLGRRLPFELLAGR